jgi:hypothetical protein
MDANAIYLDHLSDGEDSHDAANATFRGIHRTDCPEGLTYLAELDADSDKDEGRGE